MHGHRFPELPNPVVSIEDFRVELMRSDMRSAEAAEIIVQAIRSGTLIPYGRPEASDARLVRILRGGETPKLQPLLGDELRWLDPDCTWFDLDEAKRFVRANADRSSLAPVVRRAVKAGCPTAAKARDWIAANVEGWSLGEPVPGGRGLVDPDQKRYTIGAIGQAIRRYLHSLCRGQKSRARDGS